MRPAARLACALLAAAAIAVAAGQVVAARQAAKAWQVGSATRAASRFPPLRATVGDLYRSPPAPGRRVLLIGASTIRDTLAALCPVVYPDGRSEVHREGLVFVEDDRTGARLVILRRLDADDPPWVELMPLPRYVRGRQRLDRWPPLQHLEDMWMPRWADVNGVGQLVWLGLDSSVVRAHDVSDDSLGIPYRLKADRVAGRPGGPPRPTLVGPGVAASLAVALAGLLAAAGVSPRRSRTPPR